VSRADGTAPLGVSRPRRCESAVLDRFSPVASSLTTPWEDTRVRQLYSGLPATDFSGQVLAACPALLAVLPLKGVEWSDLGEPRRVMATVARIGEHPEWAADGGALRP
jgi:hypothetical protein